MVSSLVLSAVLNSNPWRWLDSLGVSVIVLGGLFGAVADWQLARFESDPAHNGKVMDAGLMRFSRHPNYFGEFWVCGGALTWWRCRPTVWWWAIALPVLATVLLLKVSGVALQEKDIAERHINYCDHIARANAFFPGRRRQTS